MSKQFLKVECYQKVETPNGFDINLRVVAEGEPENATHHFNVPGLNEQTGKLFKPGKTYTLSVEEASAAAKA